ncbi:unnamed protein product [Prorocentrum cordatum]|uniref:N-acetyltransferase domain-containing protein n=1 Tax=Prorocentrum cordatum TaxID=2364126 RepID=A0ABN9R3R1_9DINO|nr:unnamed protein product [Polarella glacialis]
MILHASRLTEVVPDWNCQGLGATLLERMASMFVAAPLRGEGGGCEKRKGEDSDRAVRMMRADIESDAPRAVSSCDQSASGGAASWRCAGHPGRQQHLAELRAA